MISNEKVLIDLAASGDKKAMEDLICDVQDMIFNLSLRILGSSHDAEDATQEIIIKIIKGLPNFRKESAFLTWVYRIAINWLLNYKKSMFAQHPLSFEYYAEDIQNGFINVTPELYQDVDENLLAEELKASCTNVMLQCLDVESRCIYVLGTMFHLDSRIAGEILDLSPEAYRQRLTRIRAKMADSLQEYCGLGQGSCNCHKRIGYAITKHRLSPTHLEYSLLKKLDDNNIHEFIKTMEQLDAISLLFATMPKYKNSKTAKEFIEKLMTSDHLLIYE